MDWRTDWGALHDRIAGIERAFTTFVQGLRVQSEDSYAIRRKVFRPEFLGVLEAIRSFRREHHASLPPTAATAIDRFLHAHSALVGNTELDNTGHLIACVTTLSAFRTELAFQLTSSTAAQLRATERALQHLQRLLVADRAVAATWANAFAEGEVACERLGASHLLLHGIWAFKVTSAGERTDLVYNEPLADLGVVARAADALVLTEWKIIRHSGELGSKVETATRQVKRYATGTLGGLELRDSRFIVVVSSERLTLPADVEQDGVFFRTRGIAISPSTPSRSAT